MAGETPSKKQPAGLGAPKGKPKPSGDLVHNTIGQVCSLIKDDKNRTRCMAGNRLYDAAVAEKKAMEAAAAGMATSGTVVGPLFFGMKSLYHQFQAADNLVAGLRQAYTGEETKTVEEIIREKLKKQLGAWIKRRLEGEKKEEEKKEEKPQEEKPQEEKPQEKPADAPKDTPADKPYDGPMDPNQPVLDPTAPGPNPAPQDIESIPMS